MSKLYPPYIEGTIPAFTGTTLVVPFSMNRAVSASEVRGMSLKVKKINTSEIILTKITNSYDLSNLKVEFILSAKEQELFNLGQYYRIQLAYINQSNTVGYYSEVGVIKYTATPEVSIAGLSNITTNNHTYDFTGVYKNKEDPTEKLYTSRFTLTDANGKIIQDSGEIIHSVLNDTEPTEAIEQYNISMDLNSKEIFRLRYIATTNNGLVISSPTYRVVQQLDSDIKLDELSNIKIIAENDYERGSVRIRLSSSVDGKDAVITGMFLLSRSEAKQPYDWKKINRLIMRTESTENRLIVDYAVEQGKEYIYCLQQYNNAGVYTGRLFSNNIVVDFEDLFLVGSDYQLKIKFNPKVASMKNNILESKVNTIGSKYPFITRNGRVNHKEFSLSGLISYQMDDMRDFFSWKDLGLENNITDLVSKNIKAEREFKLKILEWLTDGQPKILKSPVEGNYLVRLMGVSLTPVDTVGRMLHSFNCTASEIAPFNYDYLNKYEFLQIQEPDDKVVSIFKTISFSEEDDNGDTIYKTDELLDSNTRPIYSIKISDLLPGSEILLDNESFYIGATGAYAATFEKPVYSVKLPSSARYQGSILIEYKGNLVTQFDKVNKIRMEEVPIRQFISNDCYSLDYAGREQTNLLFNLTDIKTNIAEIPLIKFTKRGVHKIYCKYNEGKIAAPFYLSNSTKAEEIDLSTLEPLDIYQIYWLKENRLETKDNNGDIMYINEDGSKFYAYSEYLYDPMGQRDGVNGTLIEDSYNLFDIYINDDESVNINETEDLLIKDFSFHYLSFGDGVIANMTYLNQISDYSYEFDHPEISKIRKTYDSLLEKYWDDVHNKDVSDSINKATLLQIKTTYKELVEKLNEVMASDGIGG